MLASGPWYTSGTLWGVVGLVVSLAGVVAVLVTWRISVPKRLIIFSVPAAKPLINLRSRGISHIRAGLRIIYDDNMVSNPYIVTLNVENRGRRDIASMDYDQGKPLIFDMGARIMTAEVISESVDSPLIGVEDNQVRLGPSLIRRGLQLRLSLLTDGLPNVSYQSPLINVEVREDTYRKTRHAVSTLTRRLTRIALVEGIVVAAIIFYLVQTTSHNQIAAWLAAAAVIVTTITSFTILYRPKQGSRST